MKSTTILPMVFAFCAFLTPNITALESPFSVGASPSPSQSPALDASQAINATCPRSGKGVAADSLTHYRGFVVGFCNTHCRDDFAAHVAERPDDRAFFDVIIAAAANSERDDARERQFDFWLGEWQVKNRHRQGDGTWRPGGVAKAQISSLLSGRAILEEWRGQGTLQQRGLSLRCFDTEQERWEILLNWHSGTPSSFSQMIGSFTDGRGEFFPPSAAPRTRFTFSKAKPESCQWDQAVSTDGNEWTTHWIMSFERLEQPPTIELSAQNLPIVLPDASVQGKFPETRQLDRLIGVWSGVAQRKLGDGAWQTGKATRRTSAIVDGYALLELTEFSWGEATVEILSYNMQQGVWCSVGMSYDLSRGSAAPREADCHQLAGILDGSQLSLNEQIQSDNGVHLNWSKLATDSFHWQRQQRLRDENEVTQVEFSRAQDEGRITALPQVTSTLKIDLARAQTLLRHQHFAVAESFLKKLHLKHPAQGRPCFLLGYACHAQKKYDAAAAAYHRAREFPTTRPRALYNLACLSALEGKSDATFEYLDGAVAAGFKNWKQLQNDPDFANVRQDPRFQKLLPKKF